MQISTVSSQLQSAAAHRPAIHEQPEFARLLASPNSDHADPGRLAEDSKAVAGTAASDSAVVSDDLRKAFSDFVGQTFFSELIKSYRSTQQPAAYFNGGRAEKIFQGQLDQMFAEELSERSAEKISEPMFEQFKRL